MNTNKALLYPNVPFSSDFEVRCSSDFVEFQDVEPNFPKFGTRFNNLKWLGGAVVVTVM
jgi:hypothetical protein